MCKNNFKRAKYISILVLERKEADDEPGILCSVWWNSLVHVSCFCTQYCLVRKAVDQGSGNQQISSATITSFVLHRHSLNLALVMDT